MAGISTHITIKNLPEIRYAFSKAPRLMGDEMKNALTKSAIYLEGQSKMNTPVLTGNLRASHVFDVSGFGLQMKATVGPTADYAVFVHEGTRFQRPQPFLRDAVDSSTPQIQDFFVTAVQNVFDKIGRMT